MSFEVLRGGSHSVLCFSSPVSSYAPRNSLFRLSCQPSQPLYAPHVRIRSRSVLVQCSKREEPLFDKYEVKRKSAINRKYLSSILEQQYSIGLFGALAVVAGVQVLQSVFNPSSLEEQKARRTVSKQVELREEDLIEESEAADELSAQEDVSEEALNEPVIQETMTPAAVNAEAMENTLSGAVVEPQESRDRITSDLEDSTVSGEETIEVVSGNGASTNGATFEKNKEEKLSEQIETETEANEAILSDDLLDVEKQIEPETEPADVQDPVMEIEAQSEEIYEEPQSMIPEEEVEGPVDVQDVMSNVDIPQETTENEGKPDHIERLASSLSHSTSQTEPVSEAHERIPVVKESAINQPSYYRQLSKETADFDNDTAKGSLNGVNANSADDRLPASLSRKYGVHGLAKNKTSLAIFTASVMFVYLLLRWIVGALFAKPSTPTRKIIHNEVAQSVTITRPSIYDFYEAVDDETEFDSDGAGYTTEDRDAADYAADDEDEPRGKDEGWPFD